MRRRGTLSAIEENTSVGKIPQALFHVIHVDTPFKIGDMDILPFSISHDAAEPVGSVSDIITRRQPLPQIWDVTTIISSVILWG